MHIFLLKYDSVDYETVSQLEILGDFITVNEKTGVFNFYVPNFLEYSDQFIGNGIGSIGIFYDSH